jgi:hypothetical protein
MPSTTCQVGFGGDPRKLLTWQNGGPPLLLVKCARHMPLPPTRRQNEMNFCFFFTKSYAFSIFFRNFHQDLLYFKRTQRMAGLRRMAVKTCFWRAHAKFLDLAWSSGSPKKSYTGSGRPEGSWHAPVEVL